MAEAAMKSIPGVEPHLKKNTLKTLLCFSPYYPEALGLRARVARVEGASGSSPP